MASRCACVCMCEREREREDLPMASRCACVCVRERGRERTCRWRAGCVASRRHRYHCKSTRTRPSCRCSCSRSTACSRRDPPAAARHQHNSTCLCCRCNLSCMRTPWFPCPSHSLCTKTSLGSTPSGIVWKQDRTCATRVEAEPLTCQLCFCKSDRALLQGSQGSFGMHT